ncbi:protein of unknown function [Pseudonocardia ammonioxydans]|uniref:DUF4158 domain-containing protein n=1 Tax=Pseudonocardia ammonioxydans TaxID=260086 RepID=A0A1I5FQQ2_PSUAM|nr:DUF4158 domain-containing protein [Pseudonocardia ammonioxydans]SFO26097.1 protein of unknown function [Pseudonocardia ammonioxydans]
MATQVFSDEELERLRGFPEIGREELFRFFTLAPADVAFVDPGRGRGPADRLGLSVALCTLPWLGFVPDDVAAAPPVAVARLADQLTVDPGVLRHYGRRAKTRTEHLRLVAQYLGWRVPTSLEFKEFDEFLLARAMEHDSPTLLFRLACEYLISVQVIRPGPVTVLERVAHARAEAQRETYDRLAHEFTEQRCAGLDGLLVVDPAVGMTRLRWLSTAPVEASPAGIKAEVTKLEFLRGLGAEALDLSMLPAERCRFLATVGRRLTAQALERREPQRRYPILLTLLAQSATDVLDEVVSLFDQAVSAREGKAERTMRNALAERGKAGEDRQALLDELLAVIADTTIADEDIGSVIRGERIGWARIRAAMAQAVPRLPRDHGHLGALDVSSYGYLRQFTPQVLAAVEFAGGTAAGELLAAVEILRALNATGARPVPPGAPTGFVPTRWRGYLDTAHASGNTSAYRHFWELCTLLGLRDGLRTGDVIEGGDAAHEATARPRRSSRAQSAGRPAAEPDEMQEHFLDANERMGAALVEIGMALGLPRPGVNATWGVPEILAKIAEGAAADRAGDDAPASWVARITGPCWIVDGNDGWEQPHYPGSFAAAQAAQRAAAEDGTDPRPIRQLDQECWAAARDGHLVEDDDLGLVHHCTEGDARAAATGPAAGDDTAPPAEPPSDSFDVDRLHPFHRN